MQTYHNNNKQKNMVLGEQKTTIIRLRVKTKIYSVQVYYASTSKYRTLRGGRGNEHARSAWRRARWFWRDRDTW